MRFLTALIALLPLAFALEKPLDIEVVEKVDDCPRKTVSGDKVDVHYRGTLEADGSGAFCPIHDFPVSNASTFSSLWTLAPS